MSQNTATYAEIRSQPEVWAETLEMCQGLVSLLPIAQDQEELLFTGCGSTYYLSMTLARVATQLTGIKSRALPASEVLYYPDMALEGSNKLVIAVSRSAETSETVAAARLARRMGHQVLAITCYPDRPLAETAHSTLVTPAGQEDSVVQTRSFTSMLLSGLAWLQGSVPAGIASALPSAVEALLKFADENLDNFSDVNKIDRYFFLGGGPRYGLASEATLKMFEMALTEAASFHPLELRHGPISRVDERAAIISLLGAAQSNAERRVLQEAGELGAKTLALAPTPLQDSLPGINQSLFFGKGIPGHWQLPLYLPALQMLALRRANKKGFNPDAPRNLESVVRLSEPSPGF